MAVTLSLKESYVEAALLYDLTPAGTQSCQRYLEKRCKLTNTLIDRLHSLNITYLLGKKGLNIKKVLINFLDHAKRQYL